MSKIGKYSKPRAFGHRLVKEIMDGEIVIQEKIDGSQVSFGVIDDELIVRSKNAERDLANDKFFGKLIDYVQSIQGELIPGHIYRGEYLSSKKHNTQEYERAPKNWCVIFDVDIGGHKYLPPQLLATEADKLGFDCVPCYFFGNAADWTIEDLEELVQEQKPLLGGERIEGIVVKNYNKWLYDKPMMAKIVSDTFKEKHRHSWKKRNPGPIEKVTKELRTEARWRKAIQHLEEEGKLVGEPRDIGPLMKEIERDVMEEEEEYIKEVLFKHFRKQILRGIRGGFPEFYKKQLRHGSVSNQEEEQQ